MRRGAALVLAVAVAMIATEGATLGKRSGAPRLDGRYGFVRQPIVIVSPDSGTARIFVRVRRTLPQRRSGAPDAAVLLNGRGDFTGVNRAEGWDRCYYQIMADALPRRLPRDGSRVRISLQMRGHVRARARDVVVRHVSRMEIADERGYDKYFRRLGCRRR